MDLELSQLDKVYLSDLANYNRTLNQRNRLLKDAYYRDDILDTLDVWDMCGRSMEVMCSDGKQEHCSHCASAHRLNPVDRCDRKLPHYTSS